MSRSQVVVAIMATWVAVGLVIGIVMGRRGHHAFLWMTLGAVFGPFTIALATHAARDTRVSRSRELSAGLAGTGSTSSSGSTARLSPKPRFTLPSRCWATGSAASPWQASPTTTVRVQRRRGTAKPGLSRTWNACEAPLRA